MTRRFSLRDFLRRYYHETSIVGSVSWAAMSSVALGVVSTMTTDARFTSSLARASIMMVGVYILRVFLTPAAVFTRFGPSVIACVFLVTWTHFLAEAIPTMFIGVPHRFTEEVVIGVIWASFATSSVARAS